jgi:predicted P-loop ATPase
MTRMQNDGELIISIGKSRNDTNWKNTTMSWSALVSKLSESKETSETHEEFMDMKKDEQDQIKDIGGFVGGHLKGGRRTKQNVKARQIVTLDADSPSGDFWGRVQDMAIDWPDFAALMYSTHKHTPENPRLRLVIPLAREVSPDEYEAIARKIAEAVGIEAFDATTYETNRLMYWPSHSVDVAPAFEVHDAPFLDPDEVLARYKDWTDISEWPTSDTEVKERKAKAEKVEDPLTKKGIIGIFCRTYTITEAIRKFLPDKYDPTDSENRWSLHTGTSSKGLVIYDDDHLAYSHHSTDPISGLDVNAFDLVRIHKFGELDDPDTKKPMNRRESWKAMEELMLEDAECQKTKTAEAAAEFDNMGAPEDWILKLSRNKDLSPKPTAVNAALILENDAGMQGIRLNQMSGLIEAEGLPWEEKPTLWSDTQDAVLIDWAARKYGVEFPSQKIRQAVTKVSYDRRYHPVMDYLDNLPEWDGTERLDRLLIDYLGADDNVYTREAVRKSLTAAVARIYEPGVKFDYMMVLVGPQGAGKSTFFERIARKREWFTDSLKMDMMNKIKDSGEQLQGVWIVEIGEMTGMKKADVEAVKSFVSRTSDDYRASYGHYLDKRPRQCIVVGSTNAEEGFLRDVTGNRRFWPVHIRKGKLVKARGLTPDVVDQIWAEAKIAYELGEDLVLSPEAEALAQDAQRGAMEQDDRQGLVEEYLDRLLPENWKKLDRDQKLFFLDSSETGTVQRTEVSNVEIWAEALHGSVERMTTRDSYDIAKIMAKIPGWSKTGLVITVSGYGKQRVYKRNN